MSKNLPPPPPVPPQQLVIVTPEMTLALIAPITKALEGLKPAALIVHVATMSVGDKVKLLKEFLPHIQLQYVACLVADDPEVAVKAHADGIFAKSPALLDHALEYSPKMMVVCGGVDSKDAAMSTGETGVDALFFDEANTYKRKERVQWWAEVTEIPAIGFCQSQEEIEPMIATKADFIALGDWIFAEENPRAVIQAAMKALK